MKNKILLLVAGLFISTASAFAFNDVGSQHVYKNAIDYIEDSGIIEGYSDGSFKPDNQINRAELLKIIIESKFSDEEIASALDEYRSWDYWYVDLPDVDIDAWYGPYVRIAIREKIIEGYPDNTFRPENNVNFVEAMKMILKAYDIEYDEEMQPWFRGLVEKGAELNLNPLDTTSFDLQITRAQMAEMITRIMQHQNGTLNQYLGEKAEIKQTYTDIINGKNKLEIEVEIETEDEEDTSTEEETWEEGIVDCGTIDSDWVSEEDENNFVDCINQQFKKCEAGKGVINNFFTPEGGISVLIEIAESSEDNLCKIKMSIIDHPDSPLYIGREFSCDADPAIGNIDEALSNSTSCEEAFLNFLASEEEPEDPEDSEEPEDPEDPEE